MISCNEVESSHNETKAGSVKRPTNCPGFDYSVLPPSAADFLKGQAHRIRRQAAMSIVHIGKDLIAAKHFLSHGAFLRWVEVEVGLPPRTAQAYMQVSQWASRKNANVAHLPPSLLHLLSAHSAPESYVDDVLRRIEAGERIALPDVRTDLRDLRQNHRSESATKRDISERDRTPDQRSSPVASEMDAKLALQRVVSILTRGLSSDDFAEVREVMTSKAVIDDPELAAEIANAFSTSMENHEWKSVKRVGEPLCLQEVVETACTDVIEIQPIGAGRAIIPGASQL
jgi:hypothetical protein